MFCFAEIADSPEAVKRVTELYWWAEKGTTPASMLLPWFPSQARKLKQTAAAEIYVMLRKVYEERVAQSRVVDDTIQLMMDNGLNFPDLTRVSATVPSVVVSRNIISFSLFWEIFLPEFVSVL